MKTKKSLWLALFVLLLPGIVHAQFTYTTNNGSVTITGYTGSGGVVVIPSTIADLPVTVIANNAFSDVHSLTDLTIPDSVTNIGTFAFYNCSNMTTVSIPSSVTSIGDGTFFYCSSLTNVTIGNNITSIGRASFKNCSNLLNVTFGNSLTNIGPYSFDHCISLADVTIPNNVINVGSNAFLSCLTLSNIVIGTGFTNIAVHTFDGCTNLAAITVDSQNPWLSSANGALLNKSQTTLLLYPAGKKTGFSIPVTVTNIGDLAGQYCFYLTNISFPNGLIRIGSNSFSYCSNLADIETPDSVTTIDEIAFAYCPKLTNITLGSSATNIGPHAFLWCYGLKSIQVSPQNPSYASVDGVFFNKNLTTLLQCPQNHSTSYHVPNTVTTIGDTAFRECFTLTTVSIPNSVTTIGSGAFYYCTSLTNITIGSGVRSIDDFIFAYSGVTSLYFTGNAPAITGNYYINATPGWTIYYLPGTTGWTPVMNHRPAVAWTPQIQPTSAGLGGQNNHFSFNLAGPENFVLLVEGSTNLAGTDWFPLQTITLTNGSFQFIDPATMSLSNCFYRVRVP